MLMTKNTQSNDIQGNVIYEASQSLSTPSTGEYIMLPEQSGKMNSWLIGFFVSGGGQGKVQYSISSRSAVQAGTANWIDWDDGSVAANTTDTVFDITAVRQVNTSGTTTLEVRAS